MRLLIRPASTISTTSTVAASLTRLPSTNSERMSSRFSMSLIIGPPPWTTTGLTLHCFISTTSRANSSIAASLAHGVAAELDDDGGAVVALQEGQRLGQRAGGGDPVAGLGGGLVHGSSCQLSADGLRRRRGGRILVLAG